MPGLPTIPAPGVPFRIIPIDGVWALARFGGPGLPAALPPPPLLPIENVLPAPVSRRLISVGVGVGDGSRSRFNDGDSRDVDGGGGKDVAVVVELEEEDAGGSESRKESSAARRALRTARSISRRNKIERRA
jgi:hypothetical protein